VFGALPIISCTCNMHLTGHAHACLCEHAYACHMHVLNSQNVSYMKHDFSYLTGKYMHVTCKLHAYNMSCSTHVGQKGTFEVQHNIGIHFGPLNLNIYPLPALPYSNALHRVNVVCMFCRM